jgi:hypothetical protein
MVQHTIALMVQHKIALMVQHTISLMVQHTIALMVQHTIALMVQHTIALMVQHTIALMVHLVTFPKSTEITCTDKSLLQHGLTEQQINTYQVTHVLQLWRSPTFTGMVFLNLSRQTE